MNIEGKIVMIGKTEQVTDKFQKRDLVIEYSENPLYPQFIKFELILDKCSLLDSHKVGDHVEVGFNLKGRKWTNPEGKDKYFTTLSAWRIAHVQNATPAQPVSQSQAIVDEINGDGGDMLPF